MIGALYLVEKRVQMKMNKVVDVEEYIQLFPEDIQAILQKLRAVIQKAAPKSEEVISYNMPAYKQNGALVYFAAYKNHIGFYPTASPIKVFNDQLENYKTSKGAIQFPLDKPLPIKLITNIVKYKLQENILNQKLKIK